MRDVAEFLGLLGDADRAELERIGHRKSADRPDLLLAIGEAADRVLVLEAGTGEGDGADVAPARTPC